MLKFNMGCGRNRLEGYVNVDSQARAEADEVWDLEVTPWPWPDACATEVRFIHSLEHMGGDPKVFLAIMTELYRIVAPDGRVIVHAPHPRHDHFLDDPTHVRALSPGTFRLFDRALNEAWAERGMSNTPLAVYTGVDFHIVKQQMMVEKPFLDRLRSGDLTEAALAEIVQRQANVCYEHRIELEVRKPGSISP